MTSQRTYIDAVVEALQAAEAHLPTEYADDVDATMQTVTPRGPTYAFMPEPGRMTVLTDSESVREFYVTSRHEFKPWASRIFTHIASDWYVFQENVPTRKVLSSGALTTINTAMIFPNAGDGIQGEFLWERYPLSEDQPAVPSELGPAELLPTTKLRNAKAHARYLHCIRSGQLGSIENALADDCLFAVRSYLADAGTRPMIKAEGRASAVELLRTWLDFYEIEGLSVLTRLATEWYVFADELYTVRLKSGSEAGQLKEFRKASIYPISAGGLIQGELGYGTSLAEATSPATRDVGAISWVRQSEFTDDLCEPAW